MSLVGKPAPTFTLEGYAHGEFTTVSLESLRGTWVLLLFYPLDFTFVCPTEVLAFSADAAAFAARNCKILGISVDSKYAHKAWAETERERGGLGGALGFPLLSDLTRHTARDYGVMIEESGVALRGLFLIDPDGVVVHETTNLLPVGRSSREALRVLEAFQYVTAHSGEVCPANWEAGRPAVEATPEGVASYLKGRP
ncbi:MAG TPA: peroxiredoxin [Thermoanaerobaculaceae bacterium]|nr:peroxiredoxin [Thermoanaerobaculaceae bacterium]HRS15865.1 peroxiredoxin [Thermoanaerobaculaceae bacterium]